jgi:hypothetical protein
MAMCVVRFKFPDPMDVKTLRAALRCEVGRRASERNIEISISRTDDRGQTIQFLSTDGIAILYARKVSVALGGDYVRPESMPLPRWVDTPWVVMSWWMKFKVHWTDHHPMPRAIAKVVTISDDRPGVGQPPT